jgi:hypothetical protein
MNMQSADRRARLLGFFDCVVFALRNSVQLHSHSIDWIEMAALVGKIMRTSEMQCPSRSDVEDAYVFALRHCDEVLEPDGNHTVFLYRVCKFFAASLEGVYQSEDAAEQKLLDDRLVADLQELSAHFRRREHFKEWLTTRWNASFIHQYLTHRHDDNDDQ